MPQRRGRRSGGRQLTGHFLGDRASPARDSTVMNTARASGSCSAWAMRSAAIHDAPAPLGDDQDLGRPGVEVDRAIRRDQRLGGRHPAVARSDDLADPRHRGRAVGHRRHRVGAAEPEDAIDAGLDGRGEHHRIHRRTADDDLGHPGDPGRDRGHQQRRGQGIASAGHVAADAVEREHALRDGDARRRRHPPLARPLRLGHDANRPRRLLQRRPHRRAAPCAPRRRSAAATPRSGRSSHRASGRSAGAPHRPRPARARRSAPPPARSPDRGSTAGDKQRFDFGAVGRTDDSDHGRCGTGDR